MFFKKNITNITGLQLFQLTRFGTFLIISIVFTKSHLSTFEIGFFEILLFLAGAISFFWITGLIQSLLPLYNNNRTFAKHGNEENHKSPEIFNAFLLISAFSLVAFLFGYSIRYNFSVFGYRGDGPLFNLLLFYILLSNPTHLIEYIYLLKNKSANIINYGFISFSLQLVMVTLPILLGHGIEWSMCALIVISVLRFIWLFVLLRRYALFKFSFKFIKEHISLGFPLIISTLLSGSAQYIDGIIISNKFDASSFAVFRYGAKELPIVALLAHSLSNAMLPEFSSSAGIQRSMQTIKKKSARLMHFLFPISLFFLLFANWLYPRVFNEDFSRSADVFMVYILLIISRLVFPQTILIGLKHTRIILIASTIEIVLNVTLSLIMINYYGIVGVAVATTIVFFLEKMILIAYNYFKLKIDPRKYIPISVHLLYSIILIIIFVLIDHRIINVY